MQTALHQLGKVQPQLSYNCMTGLFGVGVHVKERQHSTRHEAREGKKAGAVT